MCIMDSDLSYLDNSSDFSSIWELYGFKTNPFSTSPLLVKGGLIPIESFSGRKEELTRLLKMFSSDGGSRTLVCGDIGVGKTTLVNVARAQINKKGFFTPFKEIGVRQNWGADEFAINTLYAIYATLKLLGGEKPVSEEMFNKLKNLLEMNNVAVTSGGLSIAGFGANVSKENVKPVVLPNLALTDLFEEIVAEIKTKTKKDIIIHYNNLERLPEKAIRKIFEDLRDFFQTPNVHFVFVGNLTVHGIFQSMPRFSSIVSDTPVIIDVLSFEEIKQILKVRFEKLRINPELGIVIPFKEDALNIIYELYSGNIRHVLNSLQTAILESTKERAMVLDKNSISIILRQIAEKRYLGKLQKRPRDVLTAAIKHNEVTNKQLASETKIARSNVSTYVGQLEENGCIYLRRRDGKDKYWSVEPKLKWILLKAPEPTDLKQRSLSEY